MGAGTRLYSMSLRSRALKEDKEIGPREEDRIKTRPRPLLTKPSAGTFRLEWWDVRRPKGSGTCLSLSLSIFPKEKGRKEMKDR